MRIYTVYYTYTHPMWSITRAQYEFLEMLIEWPLSGMCFFLLFWNTNFDILSLICYEIGHFVMKKKIRTRKMLPEQPETAECNLILERDLRSFFPAFILPFVVRHLHMCLHGSLLQSLARFLFRDEVFFPFF